MLGPVFQLEIVTAPRRLRYFVARTGYALFILLAVWLCYAESFGYAAHWTMQQSAAFSYSFFALISSIVLTAGTLYSCTLCAATISQERQRRTIEFLFASTLTNAELVLGKCAARLLSVLSLLAAAIPILFLTMIFGGVSPHLVLQTCVLTVFTVLMSGAISICVSVRTTKSRDAIQRASAVLAILLLGPPLFVPIRILFPAGAVWIEPLVANIAKLNPFLFLTAVSGWSTSFGVLPGWDGVFRIAWRQCLVAVAMLLLAIWRVRDVHLNAVDKPKKDSARRGLFRRRPHVGGFPMLWKEMFSQRSVREITLRSRLAGVLGLLVLLAPIVFTFGYTLTRRYEHQHFHIFVAMYSAVVGSSYLLLLIARSSSAVTFERERQTWEVLLSTDLPAWQIVLGKSIGPIYALRGILGIVALAWILAGVVDAWRVIDGIRVTLSILILAAFFSGIGVLFSLTARSSAQAMYLSLFVWATVMGMYLMPLSLLLDEGIGTGMFLVIPYLLWRIGSSTLDDPFFQSVNIVPWGLLTYSLLGVTVHLIAILGFDRWSGRSHSAFDRPQNT